MMRRSLNHGHGAAVLTRALPVLVWCAAPVLVACTGIIADPMVRDRDAGPGSQPDADSGVVLDPEAPFDPGTSPLRQLTHAQYDLTVQHLLGLDGTTSETFPSEDAVDGYTGQAETQSATPLRVERYGTTARELATDVTRTGRLADLVPCEPVGVDDRSCMERFVRTFTLRAFRRPATEPQVADLTDRGLEDAAAAGDFFEGASLVLEIVLQLPSFLYHVEVAEPSEERPPFLALDDFSVANRLAYLIRGSMPDDDLLATAAAGGLGTEAEVRAAAERLLDDALARRAIDGFFREWLFYAQIEGATKDSSRFPEFDAELARAMVEETRLVFEDLVWGSDLSFGVLLTADETFVNDRLAALYGVDGVDGGSFVRVRLPAERRGLFGQASFLGVNAGASTTSPTLRGKLVRERLLCQEIDDPPPGVNFAAINPAEEESRSTRERLAAHLQESCNECHKRMDPIGFGIEHFDAIGRYREEDEGGPIDATGYLDGVDESEFDGLAELVAQLERTGEVDRCLVLQFSRWARGRGAEPADARTLADLHAGFERSGSRVRELILGYATSDALRFVRPEEE